MDRKQILMNFSLPPGLDDVEVMSVAIVENLPEELVEYCEELVVQVEDFPDEALESELDLQDPYELLTLFKSGKEISPGIEKKSGKDHDILMIFRRPLLDLWCENQEDLNGLLRESIIEELGKTFEFPEQDIEDMVSRHDQSLL